MVQARPGEAQAPVVQTSPGAAQSLWCRHGLGEAQAPGVQERPGAKQVYFGADIFLLL